MSAFRKGELYPLERRPSQYFASGGDAKMFSLVRVANVITRGAGKSVSRARQRLLLRKAIAPTIAANDRVFAQSSADAAVQALGSDKTVGLASAEAARRLVESGQNELAKDLPKSIVRLFLEQFTDVLIIMLLSSCVVALALQQYTSAIAIMVVVLFNAILGTVQESRAGAALDSLASLAAPSSTVIRDGAVAEIDSALVVPGDILLLDTGKRISADCRLVTSEDMTVDEMALTGESIGVKKDAAWSAPNPSDGGTIAVEAQSGVPVADSRMGDVAVAVLAAARSRGSTITSNPPSSEPSPRVLAHSVGSIDGSPSLLTPLLASSSHADYASMQSSPLQAPSLYEHKILLTGAAVSTVPTVSTESTMSPPELAAGSEVVVPETGAVAGAAAAVGEKKKAKEGKLTDPNMVYMGCAVQEGRATALIVKTGMQTKMGEIAELLKTAEKGESPLQRKLARLGLWLGLGSLIAAIVVFVIGVALDRGDPGSNEPTWLQMLLVSVSLVVAAVPVSCVSVLQYLMVPPRTSLIESSPWL